MTSARPCCATRFFRGVPRRARRRRASRAVRPRGRRRERERRTPLLRRRGGRRARPLGSRPRDTVPRYDITPTSDVDRAVVPFPAPASPSVRSSPLSDATTHPCARHRGGPCRRRLLRPSGRLQLTPPTSASTATSSAPTRAPRPRHERHRPALLSRRVSSNRNVPGAAWRAWSFVSAVGGAVLLSSASCDTSRTRIFTRLPLARRL